MTLICFEGEHGVGKGSVLDALRLLYPQYPTIRDSEQPLFVEAIREFKTGTIRGDTFVRHVAVIRSQIYRECILPAELTCGVVFLDRYYYTSAIWQASDSFSADDIVLENVLCGSAVPDRTYIIDAPLETIISRMQRRARADDATYVSRTSSLEKNLESYRQLSQKYPECMLISNSGSLSDVVEKIGFDLELVLNKYACK